MKKAAITVLKLILFFLGWAVLSSVLPLPASEDPAVWRLWAEIMPLLAIAAFTYVFWRLEKKSVKLCIIDDPLKEICFGAGMGVLWLGIPVVCMLFMEVIAFNGRNHVDSFALWMTAAFLNVVMQELLVRGYLYQMIKQKHSLIAAAVVTTALFTLLHGGAFEAGAVPVLNVLTMSLLMTVVLEYSGSLVAPIMMHFVWNGVGSLVLGGVSLADDYPHLLNMAFSGSGILSGGVCKIEGSIIVLIINIILILLLTVMWKRRSV